MKIKLAKALKEKNRLVGEIVRLKSIIERENSRNEKSTSKVDRDDLWERLAKATESLISIKTAIFTANAKVYDKIARMGELKDRAQWITGLNTQDGEFESPSYRAEPVKNVIIAHKKQADVDAMTTALQEQIAALQDELDTYNATTEIEI